ncbi:transmembrane protein 232 [Bombina bombina]|uniref:transmembrane protein 232 n=1 Tax=Bombina bombina TaxID=8345 RepID=UPI00235B20DF|nr:transmembrane protein 232 [Bombina bombina]
MPIVKLPVVQRFGIISTKYQLDLQKRFLEKNEQPVKKSPRRPLEISEEFIEQFNNAADSDEQERMLDLAQKILHKCKRTSGLNSKGSGNHVNLHLAWTELILLARCKGKIQEEALDILFVSMDNANIEQEHVDLLFFMAETVVYRICSDSSQMPKLYSSDIKLLKLGYLTFLRLFICHIFGQLEPFEDHKGRLSEYLEALPACETTYQSYPNILLSVHVMLQIGKTICSCNGPLENSDSFQNSLKAKMAAQPDYEKIALGYFEASYRLLGTLLPKLLTTPPYDPMPASQALRVSGAHNTDQDYIPAVIYTHRAGVDVVSLDRRRSPTPSIAGSPSEHGSGFRHGAALGFYVRSGIKLYHSHATSEVLEGLTIHLVQHLEPFQTKGDFGRCSFRLAQRLPSALRSGVGCIFLDFHDECAFVRKRMHIPTSNQSSKSPRLITLKRLGKNLSNCRSWESTIPFSSAVLNWEINPFVWHCLLIWIHAQMDSPHLYDVIQHLPLYKEGLRQENWLHSLLAVFVLGEAAKLNIFCLRALMELGQDFVTFPEHQTQIQNSSSNISSFFPWTWEVAHIYIMLLSDICLHGTTSEIQKHAFIGFKNENQATRECNGASLHELLHLNSSQTSDIRSKGVFLPQDKKSNGKAKLQLIFVLFLKIRTNDPPPQIKIRNLLDLPGNLIPVGASLSRGADCTFFQKAWSQYVQEPLVLNIVFQGYRVGFRLRPPSGNILWTIRYGAVYNLVKVCHELRGDVKREGLRNAVWKVLYNQISNENDIRILDAVKVAEAEVNGPENPFISTNAKASSSAVCLAFSQHAGFKLASALSRRFLPIEPYIPLPKKTVQSKVPIKLPEIKQHSKEKKVSHLSLRQEDLNEEAPFKQPAQYITRTNIDLQKVVKDQWEKELHIRMKEDEETLKAELHEKQKKEEEHFKEIMKKREQKLKKTSKPYEIPIAKNIC